MQNETQNQDTQAAPQQQQPVVEEAQAAPEQAMDATQAATSEVVHDDPGNIPEGVTYDPTMVPDEEFDPKFVPEGAYDPRSNPDLSPDDGTFPDGEPYVPEGGYDLDFIPIDPSYDSTNDLFRTPEDIPWDDPSDTEVVSEDSNQGGYDGSGIAGGLGLDENGMPENTGINPHVQSDFPGNDSAGQAEPPDSEAVAPLSPEAVSMPHDKIVDPVPSDQGQELPGDSGEQDGDATGGDPEEDPKDRGEGVMEDDGEGGINSADADYQEVLDDLDNGNLDDVREFLESLGHSDDDTEVAPQDAPGVPDEDGKHLVDEGISIEDIVGGEENVQEGLDEGNNSTQGYTYDEDAYEDAEDAMKDLQDALKHGDEEDRAEALQKLQGYLGGFDKGAEEEKQDGTETQDGKIPSDAEDNSDGAETLGDRDGDGVWDWEDDSDGDGVSDEADLDSNNDGVEDWMVLDYNSNGIEDGKEDSDGDGQYDWQDSDSNGDGVDDFEAVLIEIEEDRPYSGYSDAELKAMQDPDGDGLYGSQDSDFDGNGIEDTMETLGDRDGDGVWDWEDSDSNGDGVDDWEAILGSDDSGVIIDDIASGNGIEDTKEYSTGDGAAVSGPALGGAAVGAGAVAGEAGGLDEDLVKEAQDLLGDMFGGGEATNAITEQAGGAIDGTLGIEGSGEVIKDIANGNFDEALGTVTDSAGGWIGEQLGSEELGDTASEVFNHVANGDFEEALDTAVEGIGDAAEDLWDSIWD